MDRFDSISPLDYRYSDEEVSKFLGEESRIKHQALIEAALAGVLAKNGICSPGVADEITKAASEVNAKEVYDEENITRHDIRALVNMIRKRVSDEAKPFVHFCATSYDIIDTANSCRYKQATSELILPALRELESTFIDLAIKQLFKLGEHTGNTQYRLHLVLRLVNMFLV